MIAALHIDTFCREGKTCLGNAYVTPPLKLMNITEDKSSGKLHLMMMSSSPGILDGDDYTLKIKVVEHGFLQLHTQSYQRIFNMQQGAVQTMEVVLGTGATFVYLPHPCVPHEQSVFKTYNKLYLQDNCTLLWGEILTCGRMLKEEVFRYHTYHSITDIYKNDRLIIKENLFMQPGTIDPLAMGQMEGFTHQAGMIVLKNDLGEVPETIHEYLSKIEGIRFGISTTPANGIIIRILGYKAEQLHDTLKQIANIILT